MVRIGQRIKELRTARKWAQDRLSLRADYDQSTLSKIERGVLPGRLTRNAVLRIAKGFGISIEELVQGTDHEHLLNDQRE